MRRLAPALVMAAVLGTPATVGAEPVGLFGYFKTICAADLDPARAAVRAAEQGFAPSSKKPRAPGMDDARGFEKTVDGREFFVIVGRGKGKPRDDMPASSTVACGVGLKGKDGAAMAAGRSWVGVPVSRTVMGVAFHGFRQTGAGRIPLSFEDKPALKAALAASDFNVLTVSGLGGVTFLMLSRTREAT